jgi:hypothetical protein
MTPTLGPSCLIVEIKKSAAQAQRDHYFGEQGCGASGCRTLTFPGLDFLRFWATLHSEKIGSSRLHSSTLSPRNASKKESQGSAPWADTNHQARFAAIRLERIGLTTVRVAGHEAPLQDRLGTMPPQRKSSAGNEPQPCTLRTPAPFSKPNCLSCWRT